MNNKSFSPYSFSPHSQLAFTFLSINDKGAIIKINNSDEELSP